MSAQSSRKAFRMILLHEEEWQDRDQSYGIAHRERYKTSQSLADLLGAVNQSHGDFVIFTEQGFTMPICEKSDPALTFQKLGRMYDNPEDGSIANLEIAVQKRRNDPHVMPKDRQRLAISLCDLGVAYSKNYRKKKDLTDLNKSIQSYQEALDLSDEPYFQSGQLRNLGVEYRSRYHATGAVDDLENSIQRLQECVAKTPSESYNEERLELLGMSYWDRYQRQGVVSDLDSAIRQYQKALDLKSDRPNRARRLHNLGVLYRGRFLQEGKGTDNEEATRNFTEALADVGSHIIDRLRAGHALLRIHAATENWPLAFNAASASVALIPLVTPRSLQSSDKHTLIVEITGLSSDAAATALMAGRSTHEVLRLLEQSRGIIVNSLGEMRSDVSSLAERHPQLAEEYDKYRSQLSVPIAATQTEANERFDASQRLEKTVQRIRGQTDFDRFLSGLSEDEMKAVASSGPLVVINASDYRCDALLVEADRLQTLPLPLLNTDDIRAYAEVLQHPTNLNSSLLEWLWRTVAEPVLRTLGSTECLPRCWPRVWWIPTGPLTRFPIHAAGKHTDGSCETVLDRVMSSYSSSITALSHSRDRQSTTVSTGTSQSAVLMAMQNTPGQSQLLFAAPEMNIVTEICESMQINVRKPSPHRTEILTSLRDCNLFHFAGHGYTDPLDPIKSSLVLHSTRLTVADLLGLNLVHKPPFLAFLSACGTGQIRDERSIDESIHLVSACQLAGFRHVIGTLWEVNDELCVDMARITYEEIKTTGMTDDAVCLGLHKACRELRMRWVNETVTKAKSLAARRRCGSVVEERLARDIVPYDSDDDDDGGGEDQIMLHWIPYVHFGC